jgi:DNA-binding CsgD family transcriptional regulator
VRRHLVESRYPPELGARQEAELHVRTAQAHAARIVGRADPAEWAELADAWAQRPMPYRVAKARWWQAHALLAAATTEEGREAARHAAGPPLSEAYELASELGALPLLREIVDLATRARVALPVSAEEGRALVAVGPGRMEEPDAGSPEIARAIEERVIAVLRKRPADTYGLSPREREVLNILAEGRTDRDIAARLFISERTVHVHVRRILAKLGVSSRTEAAGVAIRQGLVTEHARSSSRTEPAD